MYRSSRPRATRAAAAAAALALAVACGSVTDAPNDATPGVVVAFAFTGRPADTLRVFVTDSATIAAANAYVSTGAGAAIPIGPIRRGAGIDGRYAFHFVPDSVRLTEMAIELCDGRPMRTLAEVNEFFTGTGRPTEQTTTYCPWSAYPVAVIGVAGR